MRTTRRYAAVVVAAGRGARAGFSPDGPKQYRPIGGRAVLARSLDALLAWGRIDRLVVVIHPEDEALYDSALGTLASDGRLVRVTGAETRQASVLAGLRALDGSGATHVLIHDAVRPFIAETLLERIDAAFDAGADGVLPALPVVDTLKRATAAARIAETVSRDNLHAAQTPQAFVYGSILRAHEAAKSADLTDDCAVAEAAGLSIAIVQGERSNIKLTTAEDIAMAHATFGKTQIPDVRTGNGYDVHQLVDGEGVWLCGVWIAHSQMLSGHSDADVGLHALTDALLATCGAGDIGDHFPPSEARWRGAASNLFVRHARDLVRDAGGTILNADVSLVAEAPKIGPHRTAMRTAMAEMLEIDVSRCSVKATTNETIGFVGRREGIAAIATASVFYRNGRP
ncbi:bifunctional 2-C-methyl-D-erythritol 4-phosphate cytidylyltransferase/2-C-methyl-D-erythritol 2,4-cyclodiphosphate synthase [Pararhizobium mangrovi]|uniref:Bifunctional enzyme IspD/IspF n=1 Tax=Pararhizobium mangrovi TaxID=2590452 RepID=A0A506UA91_9HYPH|nr:bifunctional 2-C-methyl-D-erythritol 4-phosphate cytidylyltransferase/2-C-methyl-D-erythritol 2,4-cyclodiphosphate synthase [Pararhizobium mangrovi]TPW31352.1 bifunctional 2-C-methyl-D-erythritol 4-phosphate cytidylyltransferase/2-C-methyl-D-erythritol 2,4-cyclodiphosphate synthase [Pararhizobium mangrovi]